jgi:hypothetical protein
VVALSVPQLGPFWAGVLASPPLIAAAVAMQQQAAGGPTAARAFLCGYVQGLQGRAVFAFVLALAISHVPVLPAFLLAAARAAAQAAAVSAPRPASSENSAATHSPERHVERTAADRPPL